MTHASTKTVHGTNQLILLTSVSEEGPPAVQIAQEDPPVLELRSTAVPGVGVRRERTCFLIADQFQR